MRILHNRRMIEQLRAFLVVSEEGSLNKAARRLRLSQPALSRQMQALEHEVGQTLFERGPWGIRLTDLGHQLVERMRPVIQDYDDAWSEIQLLARGQHDILRIGYLGSAANRYLTPALTKLRDAYPNLRTVLLDLTPAEQMRGMRSGNLDIALIGQEGESIGDEFYSTVIAELGVCVAVSEEHPSAKQTSVSLSAFAEDLFVGAADDMVPGRNRWTDTLCRKAGFKPRYIAQGTSIDEVFTIVAGSDAVAVIPEYFSSTLPQGIRLVHLEDAWAVWRFLVLRQRGSSNKVAREFVEILKALSA
ncbi:LysR family transcriptional regulator [Coraliomargarita parva]|uniref:LysR family transcriptional regulator n=1 Tax=Coraliomargarita parva TaxID=3014050 RepID=UPI0022B308DB|nr:LysR family transcriptional regulator [Coraliomargarita parva]